MDLTISILSLVLILAISLCFLLTKNTSNKLPPGKLGLPIIGQSLTLLNAMRTNKVEQWLKDRADRYGPVSKMNVLGTPTVFFCGKEANKFIYTCDSAVLSNKQPASLRRILGDKNILELSGLDHKRVRGALVSFLKPEALKSYVGGMHECVRNHFESHWHGKQYVHVVKSMKTLTFDILSSIVVRVDGDRRETLRGNFEYALRGLLAIPINFPFTSFNKSLKARSRIRSLIMDLMIERRARNITADHDQQDLVSALLSMRNEDGSAVLSDEEIVDNVVAVLVAGHDTSTSLASFLIMVLGSNPSVYNGILKEQQEIARSKSGGELLKWEDLARMKYTWRVAMECLRLYPPALLTFRRVLQDLEYEGYLVPKGWQVMWSSSTTHKDEMIFPEPDKFDASRFDDKQPTVPPYTYIPFGAGSRMCPGNEFNRIETLVAIHYAVTHFSWELCCPQDALTFKRDPLPNFDNGLKIKLHPREHHP